MNQISQQTKEQTMYARVTTGQFQPGTSEALMPFFESAAHQQQGMQGFVSAQLLIDRTANTFMVVTVCATLADLEASGTVPRKVLADPRVVAALAGPPVIAVYEVAVQVASNR
jgi:heme-degrading monooxygenase HmoA